MEAAQTLTGLGLSQYEAKAYLALARRSSATPAEVGQVAGIPRQRVYDVLRGLAERDLVGTVQAGQLRYAAVAPDRAIARLLDQQRRDLHTLEQHAATLTEELTELWRQGRREDTPLHYVEVLRDRAAVSARMTAIFEGMSQEYLVLARPPYFSRPDPESDPTNVERMRAIYERGVLDDPPLTAYLRRCVAAGAGIRLVDSLPTKLAIVDGRLLVVHLPDPVAGDLRFTTLLVEHPDLAAVLRLAFDALWESGEPLEPA